MGLLSIFRRRADATSPSAQGVGETGDAVQRARTRARQRLIGAVVLVGLGIIGFPLVFETQPRPIPVDIPIEIPRKEGATTLPMPPARAPALPAAGAGAGGGAGVVVERAAELAAATPTSAAKPTPARDEVITESRDEPGRERAVPAAPARPAASAAPVAVAVAVAKKVAEPKAPATLADGARAKALLEGKQASSAPASGARFVVQVGAFADASSARETRLKIEKLGLKTYTQVADTPSGSRIRVRVGPFATRDEADQVRARARSAGLGAVVLTL